MKNGLNEIISKNEFLLQDVEPTQQMQIDVVGVLRNIESIIPEDSRENFYTNLRTLRVVYGDELLDEKNAAGLYNKKTNTITLNRNIFTSVGSLDGQALMTIYHEMLHMASTRRDERTGYFASGFQNLVQDENGEVLYEEELTGMTEGFTELLVTQAFGKRTFETMAAYGKQMNFTEHLALIAKMETIKRAYFNNSKGMAKVDKELESLDESITPTELYGSIESEYRASERNETHPSRMIADIEQILLHLSREKAVALVRENPNITSDEINEYWRNVAGTINFSEKLELMGEDPTNHEGLEQLRPMFFKYRQQTMDMRDKQVVIEDIEEATKDVTMTDIVNEQSCVGEIEKEI